jgi:hypothetical protein
MEEPRRDLRIPRELHQAIASKLPYLDRSQWGPESQRQLDRKRSVVRGGVGTSWLDSWQELLDGPTEEIIDLCTRIGEWEDEMRKVSPLGGILTEAERLAAIERAYLEPPDFKRLPWDD